MIDFKKELNSEQYEIVQQGDGYVLVLAGAGSGKTRVITYRVAYLLEKSIAPSAILLLTFTNKAAKEMLTRVEKLMGEKVKGLWSGTFHSVASRVLRVEANAIGFEKNFTIMDQDDAEVLLKHCLQEEGLDTKSKKTPAASTLLSMVSYARNTELPLDEVIELKYPRFMAFTDALKSVAERYKREKRRANVMDFDDLLTYWLELLEDHEAIRNKWAEQFKYILVDEFQDTNKLQAKIVRLLAETNKNLFVVGDDAQSIYSFRAADIHNILNFPKEFVGAKTFKLEINYRSSPEILLLANGVISQNKKQFKKTLKAHHASNVKPHVMGHMTPAQEAQYIVQKVARSASAGRPLASMAALFRSAFAARALEMELVKNNIPYEFRGGMRFFDRAHIKDVLGFLRIISNHKDRMAWLRVLPLQPGIGHETARTLVERIMVQGDLEAALQSIANVSLPARARTGWDNMMSIIQEMKKRGSHPSGFIEGIAKSAYADYLKDMFENYEDRLGDLEQLAQFASHAKSTKDFLDSATLDDAYGSKDKVGNTRDRLILSTIHQAKGLEWDTVFVINLVNGAFPNERALSEAGGEEEERRLFYVAVTRAQRELFLTYAMLDARDPSIVHQASQFLQELHPSLVKKTDDTVMDGNGQWNDDVPTIVIDEDAQVPSEEESVSVSRVATPKKRKGFLREIDEL